MRRENRHRVALAMLAASIATLASDASAQTVFEDTFNYAASADMINPAIGGWTPFLTNPSVVTSYTFGATASGYINAGFLPPTQTGLTLVNANNRGAYHDLSETLSDNWTLSASLGINAYSRAVSVGLMNASGSNGYAFTLNTSNPNSFSGKGFLTLRKVDTWLTGAPVATTQGTQLGTQAAGVSWPLGFALPTPPPGGFNTTDGIPFAPDAPFLGFTNIELSYSAGVLTLKQDGTVVRTLTDTSFSSFGRIYYTGGTTAFLDNVSVMKNIVTTSASWNVDADGDWSTASNWTGNIIPSVPGAVASFGPNNTAPRAITLSAPITVGGLDLSSAFAYTIGGTSALSFDVNTGSAVVNVGAGAHTVAAPVTLNDDLLITAVGGTTVDFTGDVNTNNKNVVKNGGGVAQFKALRGPSLSASVGIIRIASGATPNTADHTSVLTTLILTATGKLDLNNNSLVLDYSGTSPADTVRQQIASAWASGAWTGGTGIGSSTAAIVAANAEEPKKTAIGFAEASSLGLTSYNGINLAGDALILAYTVYGDATLDGSVNFDDLLALSQNYDAAGTGKIWGNGDFNYDGVVAFDDLLALAQNYNQSLSSSELASLDSSFAADFALARSLVPEPVSASTLAIGTLALLKRRR